MAIAFLPVACEPLTELPPMAIAPSFVACVAVAGVLPPEPMAVEFLPVAVLFIPMAVACLPEAVEAVPIEVAPLSKPCALAPKATAPVPSVFAVKPNAVLKLPKA